MTRITDFEERPVALITGGRRGIGASIVLQLAKEGFDIAFTCRSEDSVAKELCSIVESVGSRALAVASELQDLKAQGELINKVIAWGGKIDCLVNNAGIGSPSRGDLLEMQPEAFDLVLDTNLRGTFFLTQQVAKHMLATPSSSPRSIITISSVSASMASTERGEYCLSKAALAMGTKLFALRLAEANIGVFEVRPGIIRTDMTAGVASKYEERFKNGLVPMARWGETEDIAAAVSSLASGKLNFSTGSVINIDGGLSIPSF
ncbi:3-ketoacyl-ACP reductase [Acinetobacter baumannii]|uniref:3-ketoacyl-ACP reductase n=1 Tax=Acinetobacter baumannii TaxID=470 RepID=UPI0018FFB9C6|nr:3-ketoacyl-ACP reductase [Acinetobacter baumannii]MBJ9493364.1 3-ketoacyl-ACP reductase [Acinetobacter baumannii]MCT9183639.1 3-ketoacyl-ACP reductase [Acinetobacter baumannii]MCT9224277.1 3-ketoacyl-ACP reductase [Acinetobacter baumannii]MCT9276142.1 3-ketoacyl-ACP reductase [Acinetobacter baumannii]